MCCCQMTVEEKVGQLFMAYFDGDSVNEHAKRLIQDAKIGGIIYYQWANGLYSPEQVKTLSHDLQKLADIPLFIAIDQEGGVVSRLQNGFTEFPGNAALARAGVDLAYKASYCMAKEMLEVGVNFNLAPVVDINNNPDNPIIGIRSFGADPELVTRFAKASVEGFYAAGIISCLKHFPGHGDVTIDSHKGRPIVDKSYEALEILELVPFKQVSAPAIMTAHILYPQIDPSAIATLSQPILEGVLREKLRFKGLVVSDSLVMKAVGKKLEDAVLDAFLAGNDLLLIGGRELDAQVDGEANIDEILRAYKRMVEAVRDGTIGEERLNASVARILEAKKAIGVPSAVNREEHAKVAKEIAERSIVLKKGKIDQDLSQQDILIICPKHMEEKVRKTDLITLGKKVTLQTVEACEEQDADFVIFCSYNLRKDNKQLRLLQEVARKIPTACIAVADPSDLALPHESVIQIATYSPTGSSLQAAAVKIFISH